MKFENFLGKKTEVGAFNFNEAYKFLKQEQKIRLFKALDAYRLAAEGDKGRDAAWFELAELAREVLGEEKLPTDLATVNEFVGGLSKIPNQSNYVEAASIAIPEDNNEVVEVETPQEISAYDTPATPVVPTRVPSSWAKVLQEFSNNNVGAADGSIAETQGEDVEVVKKPLPRELQPDELRHRPIVAGRQFGTVNSDTDISPEAARPQPPRQTL